MAGAERAGGGEVSQVLVFKATSKVAHEIDNKRTMISAVLLTDDMGIGALQCGGHQHMIDPDSKPSR